MLCIIIGWFVGIMTMYNSYTPQLCMLSCSLAKVINQNTWCDCLNQFTTHNGTMVVFQQLRTCLLKFDVQNKDGLCYYMLYNIFYVSDVYLLITHLYGYFSYCGQHNCTISF